MCSLPLFSNYPLIRCLFSQFLVKRGKKGTGYFLNLIVVVASKAWQSLLKNKEEITEKKGAVLMNCQILPNKYLEESLLYFYILLLLFLCLQI